MFILIGISVNVINQEYLQLDTIWIMAAVPDGRYRMIDVAWFIILPIHCVYSHNIDVNMRECRAGWYPVGRGTSGGKLHGIRVAWWK